MSTTSAVPESVLRRWVIFAAAVLPGSLYVATQTVANAALPQMQGDLSAGLDQISWVVTISVVAGAIGIHLQLIQRRLGAEQEELGSVAWEAIREAVGVIEEEVARLNQIVVDYLFAVRPIDVDLTSGEVNDTELGAPGPAAVTGPPATRVQAAALASLPTDVPGVV